MKTFLERFAIGCLYAALFTPLVFYSHLMHPLVVLKTAVFQGIIAFGFAAYASLAVRHSEYRPRMTGLLAAAIALFGVFVISSALGASWSRSVWSVPERMTGLIFSVHLLAFFTMLRGLAHRISWGRYLATASWAGFAVALLPVVHLIFPGIFFDRTSDRLAGTVGNPIFLSLYLTVIAGLSAHLASRMRAAGGRLWLAHVLIAAFSITIIILTQTRGAFLGLIAAAAAFSWHAVRSETISTRAKRVVAGAWIVAVLSGIGFFFTNDMPFWQSVPIASRLANEGFKADARILAWKAGLKGFADRPVLGWGMENFQYAFNAHYDPQLLRRGFIETFFDRPHNLFLQALVEGGVAGFAAYCAAAFFALRAVGGNPFLIAMAVAYAVQGFFAFDSLSGYMMLVVALAYADAAKAGEKRSSIAGASEKPGAGMLFACFAAVAIAITYASGWRIVRASSYEWQSINYFLQRHVPEGADFFDKAVTASAPYHDHIVKDLAPNITGLYAQNVPLPDAPSFVRRAIDLMRESSANRREDYAFQLALADMVPAVAALDPAYLDIAMSALDAAESASPRRQATRYVRAKILNLKGDKAGAIREMQAAIDLDDQVPDAHFYLGLLLAESGDLPGAAGPLKRAEALGRIPKSAAEARLLGGYFGDAGMYADSARYFERAVLLAPDDLESKMKLGLVYYFAGNKDAARRVIGDVMKKSDLKSSPQYGAIRPILIDLGLEK